MNAEVMSPKSACYLMSIGYRGGLDHAVGQQARADRLLVRSQEYIASGREFREDGKRFYIGGGVFCVAGLISFIAAWVVSR